MRVEIGQWLRDCRNRSRLGQVQALVGVRGDPYVRWNNYTDTIVSADDVHDDRLSITGYMIVPEASWLKK